MSSDTEGKRTRTFLVTFNEEEYDEGELYLSDIPGYVTSSEVDSNATVTDAEVENASEKFAASILATERESRLAQNAFVAGVEWRERAMTV